jgi:DNA primase
MVSPAKGIFKCFSSGKGGNHVKFIREKESLDFPEAIRFLCKKYNIECKETEMTSEEQMIHKQKESLYIINKVSNDYYKANLMHQPLAYDYLVTQRKISTEMINRFDIGYAPPTLSGLTSHLVNNGYNWQMAVQASVLGYVPDKNRLYDRFRNRIMFPIRNIIGNVIGFGGRALQPDEKNAKYLNSSDSVIYNKSEALYGIFEAKQSIVNCNECLLSEGYTDVISFHQKGIENIVASAGTALTIDQVKLIKRFSKNIIVIFDGDNAGIQAALRGIDILLSQNMNVKVLILPDKQDPDDFAKTRTKEEIVNYILDNKKDFIIFKLDFYIKQAKGDLGMVSNAIVDVVGSISKIPNPVQREVYLRECSRLTEMNIDTLRIMLKTVISEDQEFEVATAISFQEQATQSKNFIKDECERKILQYILAYGNMKLDFKEIMVRDSGFEGHLKYDEIVETNTRTVLEKVVFELDNDNIIFNNPLYYNILSKAKTIDLSHFYLLKDLLDSESYLLAENMRKEELEMNINSFTKENVIGNEIVEQELRNAIARSINESLLFYKSIYIEGLIEEESMQEVPDVELIKMYIDLMIKIKTELNLI